ncbi:hypothetical protein RBI22_19865 [Alcaligenaceae bacterium C4P045]|nr:hypothetical protein [Alcaligenaceae bacterium C4P045]
MFSSAIPMPRSGNDWAGMDIPHSGILHNGTKYFKHGFGCTVLLPVGAIDFDFGRHGEINGFDWWRLTSFAKLDLECYGFETHELINELFDDAVKNGEIVCSEPTVCYLKNCKRVFAVEVSCGRSDDRLPHQDYDMILTLYAQCLLSAKVMRSDYKKIVSLSEKKGKLSQAKQLNLRVYGKSWLAYLLATCEGFKKINVRKTLIESRPAEFLELLPKCDRVGSLIKKHYDALREFRNNVFHVQSSSSPIIKFFDDDSTRLDWAETVHDALEDFCSDYRVLCEVHYAEKGRIGEGSIGMQKKRGHPG